MWGRTLVSNLKFEVWLRWHAEETTSSLSSSQLDERVAKLGLVKNKILLASFPIHEVLTACAVARRVDPDMVVGRVGPDPSSAMPILVDLLRGTPQTWRPERGDRGARVGTPLSSSLVSGSTAGPW